MENKIKNFDTPEKCEAFANNALRMGREDLANKALQRAIEIKSERYGASSQAEKEALQAIYAYEETLRIKNGKRTRANRTWQMISRYGIIESVNRAVCRTTETQGYRLLINMGLGDFAFEAVILRHPTIFSKNAVRVSQERLDNWKQS